MKKYYSLAVAALVAMAFSSCGTSSSATGSALGSVLTTVATTALTNSASSSESSAESDNSGFSGILDNLLASVTGSVTTTKNNLIGTWSYIEPSVQFESENYLTQAGGTAAASKIESQLVSVYKLIDITKGHIVFTFNSDGTLVYKISSTSYTGTYTFDSTNRTVAMTTKNGATITAYVNISGNQMCLCFDSTKLLSFLGNGSNSTNATLNTIGALAQSFSGMKTGFKFEKK